MPKPTLLIPASVLADLRWTTFSIVYTQVTGTPCKQARSGNTVTLLAPAGNSFLVLVEIITLPDRPVQFVINVTCTEAQ